MTSPLHRRGLWLPKFSSASRIFIALPLTKNPGLFGDYLHAVMAILRPPTHTCLLTLDQIAFPALLALTQLGTLLIRASSSKKASVELISKPYLSQFCVQLTLANRGGQKTGAHVVRLQLLTCGCDAVLPSRLHLKPAPCQSRLLSPHPEGEGPQSNSRPDSGTYETPAYSQVLSVWCDR